MADKGWIKLNRQITDHWIWKNHEYAFAWIDLLLLAEHKTHKSIWRGNITDFKRGDVCLSIAKLGERWGWSRKKVKHFLEQLEDDQMVHLNTHRNRTTITIVNYGLFQDKGTSDGTSKGTSKGTTERTSKGTSEGTYLKNNKNDKEEKNMPAVLPDERTPEEIEIDELYERLEGLAIDDPRRRDIFIRLGELEGDE